MVKQECKSCKHSENPPENHYCYMFKVKPEIVPCAQHDMYYEIRKETGRMIKNNPLYIFEMLEEMNNR